jgi:purine-nucleoside/S-methyl-5'-thioadenosine phosphorylase / adenosine deaminase
MPGVVPLRSKLLSDHGFRHGFSPRAGGVSLPPYASCNLGRGVGDNLEHVAENHRRFAETVGYAPAALFELSQVHGRVVREIRPDEDAAQVRAESGDGLVGVEGAVVGVRTADCVPVLVADPTTRHAAALHAGWRGVALGIVPAGVARLAATSGAPAERLIAAVFPHIAVCCFEVSDEVAQQLMAATPLLDASAEGAIAAGGALLEIGPRGKPHVNLAALVRLQLLAAGIDASNIDLVAGCTRCDAERFFSFRRDGQASGRHLTAIVAS